jgi:dihydrofolate reductase
MRRIRYSVAASLDGYIAGPKGEYDWIIMDPDIDFNAMFQDFDTVVMGRRSFETMSSGQDAAYPGMKTYVISRTLRQSDYSNVTIISEKPEEALRALKEESGKDIWLFGGGLLFRTLAQAGLVDKVEVAVMPVLIGGGIALLPPPADQVQLKLTGHKVYKTGIVGLEYEVQQVTAGPA